MSVGEVSLSRSGELPGAGLSLADPGDGAAVDPRHEAQWTRLFADWLEEQGRLVLAELERDGDRR